MIITCPHCSTRYSLPQDKIKPGGQKVRCAKCGTAWYQAPEEPAPPMPASGEETPPPPPPAWSPAAPAEPAPPQVPPIDELAPAAPPAESAAPVTPAETASSLPPDSFAQFHRQASVEQAGNGAGRKWAIAVIVLVALALAALVFFRQEVQDLTGIQLMLAPQPAPPAAADVAAPATEALTPPPLTLTFEEVESSIEEIDGIRRLMVKGLIVNPADHEQLVPPLAFSMLDRSGAPIDRWTFDAPVRALAPHTTTRFSGQRDTPPTTLHELVPGFDLPETQPSAIEAPPAAESAADTAQPPAATPPQ